MKELSYNGFEQGPIRPPSEAQSLLIRITRNCPWNRCTFCPVYKGLNYSKRPTEHVLQDIDTVHNYVQKIRTYNNLTSISRNQLITGLSVQRENLSAFNAAYNFVLTGMRSVFLQDANSLIVKADELITIVRHIRNCFPEIERITSYARAVTVAKIADEQLRDLFTSGLNRIHIGMESGSDKVLSQVHKGTTKKTLIEAGTKIKRSGMELSYYYIPGLGGKALSFEHARESADVLNRVQPDFIRLRSLALPPGTVITQQCYDGEFEKCGEVETCRELREFLLCMNDIPSIIRSDHILNLLIEIDGSLAQSRKHFIERTDRFLSLSPYDQMLFIIGRRTDRIYSLDDLNQPAIYQDCEEACKRIGATPENVDHIAGRIAARYI